MRFAAVVGSAVIAACGSSGDASTEPATPACLSVTAAAGTRVLVFSRTAGFRHASIPDGIATIAALGVSHGFAVEQTEDPATFRDDQLARFRVVVFLNTSGDVLDAAQQAAFERYIRAGGGFVGVHAAADTEYDWAWYGQLMGAYFSRHPDIQQATVRRVTPAHLSTQCVPVEWNRTDEWYDFRSRPTDVTVLATVDESTYQGGAMGEPHPIAWFHLFDGGRAWFTAMGHTSESYSEAAFRDHLAGGILWASQR